MHFVDFYERINAHQSLTGLDVDKEKAIIRHDSTNAVLAVPVTTIASTAWAELEAVLLEKQEPGVLHHITRVVGYFSRVQNWNASKLGELSDRHKGEYSLDTTD